MGHYKIERSLLIDAPAEKIWDELVDVKSWPQWKPMVPKTVYDDDKLKVGKKFKLSLRVKGPIVTPVTCDIIALDKYDYMAWTGGLEGLSKSVHSFLFKEEDGKTLVTSREEFTGIFVSLMLIFLTEKDFETMHDQWLLAIKKHIDKKYNS
jgi:hypothetical protein